MKRFREKAVWLILIIVLLTAKAAYQAKKNGSHPVISRDYNDPTIYSY